MAVISKREILRYECRVKGLFGRNRSIKTDCVKLVDADAGAPKSLDEVMPLFRQALASMKFKGGYAQIWETPITVEENDYGGGTILKSESFLGGKKLHEEKIEGGNVRFGA